MLELQSLHISAWYWFIFAILLLLLELTLPATFFLWLSLSAGVMGGIVYFFPTLSLGTQLLIFSGGAIFSLLLSRLYITRNPIKSTQPLLNRRGAEYVGRTFTLSEAIVNGFGKVRVDDSIWRVEGTDAPIGTQVKVIGLDGATLKVVVLQIEDK